LVCDTGCLCDTGCSCGREEVTAGRLRVSTSVERAAMRATQIEDTATRPSSSNLTVKRVTETAPEKKKSHARHDLRRRHAAPSMSRSTCDENARTRVNDRTPRGTSARDGLDGIVRVLRRGTMRPDSVQSRVRRAERRNG